MIEISECQWLVLRSSSNALLLKAASRDVMAHVVKLLDVD